MSEAPEQAIQWVRIEDARTQAREFVLGFLPQDEDPDHDCETCRTIKAIAAGFGHEPDNELQPDQ